MSRMAELAAELPPEDGNAALHFDLVAALTRVAAGTSTASASPWEMRHRLAKRSLIRSWCGENVS
jgi:hypothetical protein